MKQDPPSRRLTGMQAPLRQIVVPILRMGAMVGLAMLLIMGLFPAILEAQAGRNRRIKQRLGARGLRTTRRHPIR